MPSSSFDKHFADLRITLEEIKSATKNFSEAHIIRRGGFGEEYRGQLEQSGQLIDIVARRFDNKHGQGSKEFHVAILMLSSLKHENLVSILGFCDEGGEQIIINKRDAKGSLDQYLRDPSLTWIRRLEICVGVAHALSYIHYDKKREFSVIHRNIKSCNVLVDDNWKPKLSGFEHSMKTTSRRHRLLLSGLCGTLGYIDPVYEKTGGVTHKSDVYSFGVVLFEVLCGRKSSINREGLSSELAEKEMGKGDQIVKHEGNSGQLIKPHSKGAEMIKPHSRGFTLPSSTNLNMRHLQHSTNQLINTFSGFVHNNWSAFNDLYGEMEGPGLSGFQRPNMSSKLGPDVYSQEMYMFTIPPSGRFRPNLYFSDEEFLAPLAISGYDQGKLDAMIDPHLRKQMDPQSFQVFSETAYYCLKEQRSQRPDMTQVFIKLKEALDHQRKYENHEHSEATSTNHLKGEDLKQLEIPLHDIKSATGSFSKGLIGAGTFGEVYKAELDHFDRKKCVEEKIIGELPKKRSTVAIKRIKIRDDKQGEEGFLAEIDMLTSCDHPNIVSLLGFCEEGGHMILVYEYASNGSLSGYLGSAGSLINLTWVQRINICIGIARGLDYLHTKIDGERRIIHRDVKSDNILLGENWEAKIADFGLSTFRSEDQQMNKTVYTQHIAGTEYYLDPEYVAGKLKNESDIYSFGVVLFEMMSGKFAYDPIFTNENSKGIAHVARRRFKEGINSIKGMVDPRLMEETQDNTFTLNKGPDQDSLYAFSEIAYQCVAETQAERPTAEVVVKKLEEALAFQKNHKDRLQLSLEDIKSATDTFSHNKRIGKGGFGGVYKGEVKNANGRVTTIAAKRLNTSGRQGETEFLTELEILLEYNHENVIGLVGYCNDPIEKIIVYEYASRGSLDTHLKDNGLTWMTRLHISIDIARGLDYLHLVGVTQEMVIHRDIKSANILLNDKWRAKISDFGLSLISPVDEETDFVIDHACGTPEYCDPLYLTTGFLTKESDIYSLGVVLFEILCGRFVYEKLNGSFRSSNNLFKHHYEEGTLHKIMLEGIKEQIAPKSLHIFQNIAYQCLHDEKINRPTTSDILSQLEKALEFQEDYDKWGPKLPQDYKKLIRMTNSPEIYSIKKKEDLYYMFRKGIILQKGKVKNHKDTLQLSLEDIKSATDTFSHNKRIGEGGFGGVYKGEVKNANGRVTTIAAKRLNTSGGQGENEFMKELEILLEYNHENVIGLVGYCDDPIEKIIVYEYASRGSLDRHLKDNGLTWMTRLHISIDIARGLDYLHLVGVTQEMVMHRDIKSANILLNDEWRAKISDFGLSLISPVDEETDFVIDHACGTPGYCDPLYFTSGFLTKESDIYSLGVVLFEILCGRLVYEKLIGFFRFSKTLFKHHYEEGTLHEIMLEGIKAQIAPKSLHIFQNIAYQCLDDEKIKRPTTSDVLSQLEKALEFQEDYDKWGPKLPQDYEKLIKMTNSLEIYSTEKKEDLYYMFRKGIILQKGKVENPNSLHKYSLEDIEVATHNFCDGNLIGKLIFGNIYKGEIIHVNGCKTIAAKRWDLRFGEGETEFLTELEILLEYKHENIISLVGYCNEQAETIIVTEYASRGSLDTHLKDNDFTWMKRLQISIDIARGLDFLHGGGITQKLVIHRDIKSANILLNDDWRAKICNFGLSFICPIDNETNFFIDIICGTPGYIDPLYETLGLLTKESDIYSLGVVLFEILCGRLVYENVDGSFQSSNNWFKNHYEEGKIDEIMFEGIKEQIAPKSLTVFQNIAYRCLHDEKEKRPTTSDVLSRLEEALKFQKDYEKLVEVPSTLEFHSTKKKDDKVSRKDNGNLQKGKVLFSLDGNGERSEMISAVDFSYKHRLSYKWRSFPESRFKKVAEMSDVSNLNIHVKMKPRFLSPGINYGVHLVFRFCGPRNFAAKWTYVNLKYKKGRETLHTYFATWREDGWMRIELCRFLNQKDDIEFEFLLESFSRCYCKSRVIYIEGIEFRAIDNNASFKVKCEEIKESKEVHQLLIKSDLTMDQVQQLQTNCEKEVKRFKRIDEGEKLFLLKEVNEKKHYMLSTKEALYESSDVKLFNLIPSTQSRFPNAVEFLRQQVFRIKFKIESQRLSTNTEYACYIVFKLSEKCHGLHCPVIIRDLLHRKNKEKGILYFRSPSPCNVDDATHVPKEREDGWMEVNVWKFNSSYELRNGCISMILKLISYEGTMSGLIVSGLEFRPM